MNKKEWEILHIKNQDTAVLVVPKELLDALDQTIAALKSSQAIKSYHYMVQDQAGASLQDCDVSDWEYSDTPVKFKRDQGTTWFRFHIDIPDVVDDIQVEGSGVRLMTFFLAPVDIYVDGQLQLSERVWLDFKIPELYLTKRAKPGQSFQIAVKMEFGEECYFDGEFSMNFIIENVEDALFEISCFKEELLYACGFPSAKEILPNVFKLISDSTVNKEGAAKLVDKIRLSREMLKPVEAEAKEHTVHLIGHAHIDMNWFWSMEDTLDLVKRDFGTMLGIMEELPEFRFSQSQCAAYEMAENHFPDLFEKMKKVIQAGNWDVTATTWVEGDMNMASGESIVRHLLYSKKYIHEHFGIDPRVMWCPDTFGHSANVPQIMKKAGIDYYFFMRCGKDYATGMDDAFYYGAAVSDEPLFWWEGIDGSRVLAYNATYNSDMNPTSALRNSKIIKARYGTKHSMYVYGTGDHGGGPTRRDLKRAQQMNAYPTMPKLEFSTTHQCFDQMAEAVPGILPVEKGEMNFVFDGCYTTQAKIKRYNRFGENRLVSTEIMGSMGALLGRKYNCEEIEESWKSVLFNQFHDIFDGSSIRAGYHHSWKIAEAALDTADSATRKYASYSASRIKVQNKGVAITVFNTTGWKRSECIRIDKPDSEATDYFACDFDDNRLPIQECDGKLLVYVSDIPPIGYKVIYLDRGEKTEHFKGIKENTEYFEIETKYYWIEIKKDSGEIATLFDKINKRYVVRKEKTSWRLRRGVLNTLKVYYEAPIPMSSWTIAPATKVINLISGAKATIKEGGPVVKIINFEHRIGDSTISQDMVVYEDSPRIDFQTHVEWNEYGGSDRESPMLKVCFIPDIDNASATYEIPFGVVDRPCKDIEVPALQWIDISDEDYGFSLLNDCKYGHKVTGNVMEMTLIRSGWEPDPKSDVGTHDFIYSIMPHQGSWRESQSISQAHFLNHPLIIARGETVSEATLPETFSFVEVDVPGVIISSFKPSEDGIGYILRLYEGTGTSANVKIKFGFDIDRIEEVDLNENKIYREVGIYGINTNLFMNPFEIMTFKIYPGKKGIWRK